jgi:hypothetical protein
MAGSAFSSTPFTNYLVNGGAKADYQKQMAARNASTPAPARAAPRPAASQASAPRNTGSSPGGTTSTGNRSLYAAPDPYAKWGGVDNYNKLKGDYDRSKGTAYNSITDSINFNSDKFHSGILDFIDNLKTGQDKLNRTQIQDELAKGQGRAGVLDMVGHGIRSAGVQLANKNSGSSSAAKYLADAWGETGRDQANDVEGQYAQAMDAYHNDQDTFDRQIEGGVRHLTDSKNEMVNNIVNDAVGKLSELNAKAASASLDDRVDIEAEKNRIRSEAIGKLQSFDGELAQGREQNKAMGNMDAKGKAFQQQQAGVAADNPFKYDTVAQEPLQNTGPFNSPLPVFQVPKNKNEQK